MSVLAFVVLIVAAVIVGFVAQTIGTPRFAFDWIFAGIGAAVGAFIAGQYMGVLSTWGPLFEGIYIVPALIGAVFAAVVVEAAVRLISPTPTTA